MQAKHLYPAVESYVATERATGPGPVRQVRHAGTPPPPPPFQYFWRCAHYPSALDNFQANRTTCEWECHTQELKWYNHGFHPVPNSWPAVHDDVR